MKTILVFGMAAGVCFGQGVINTIAGNGTTGYGGDGGSAISAQLSLPTDVVVDSAGNVYIADYSNSRVRKVTPAGTITTFAGTGKNAFSGDGGPAASAALFFPVALAIDSAGNIYIADQGNEAIRKVNSAGVISTIAGRPVSGGVFSAGDSVAIDAAGNIYSSGADGILKIDTSGNQTTIAGGVIGFSGDGGPAKSAALKSPKGIVLDTSGNLYFADAGNNRIRKIDKSGIITTIAGTGIAGFSGDGGPATQAQIRLAAAPFAGLSLDSAGNLYFADYGNNRIRMINPAGVITTVAGGGGILPNRDNPYGDGQPATKANLMLPRGVFVDGAGNIFIADTNHGEVRKVSPGSGTTTPPPGPSISANGVVNAASFAAGVTANSWITILGTNLAAGTDDWSNAVVNGQLPTTLDGVSVSIGGKPAYVYFVSPGQINVLAPDTPPGTVTVTVTTPGGATAPVNATAGTYGPAFFLWPSNQVVATRPDYSFAAKAGTFAGATTVPAKPGEVVILWGTGFGPTNPTAPIGVATSTSQVYSTVTQPAVTLGSTQLKVLGAALAPGSAGLYQIAVQLPAVADGSYPIQASIGGVQSSAAASITVCASSCSIAK